MPQTAAAEIAAEITAAGELMQQAALRYETVFRRIRSLLRDAASGAAGMADGALSVMAIADAAANAFQAQFPNQPARDCRAGCDACCHLYVMIPPGVAEAIGSYLTRHLEHSALVALRGQLTVAAAAAIALPDPSKLRRRCPLLGADGRCTIYEVRPLTCRAFTSSSALACRSMVFDADNFGASIPQNPSQFRVYVEATAALEQAAAARGLSSQQVGLAAGLLAVLPGSQTTSALDP